MEKSNGRIDAGLASLDHYKTRLPQWRHRIRQRLLPIVREETPYVALLQKTLRSPALDAYFAMTANLGTHTAFMISIPILFWCGYMYMARAMIHMLAAGVFWSGFVKDLLCLPRPLSPPLQRITMSGSAALEYGFPSTHSTNAVSVAYCVLYLLRNESSDMAPGTILALQVTIYVYACSIVLGRVYCGMHGFFDVVLGSALGAAIGAVQSSYGPAFDQWLYSSPMQGIATTTLVILALVWIHPDPADDCPCFDDSVAFAGVILGCEVASWRLAQRPLFQEPNGHAKIPFNYQEIGWFITMVRIVIGVIAIFTWRTVTKPLFLKVLPPIFRRVEQVGLDLPRRYFMPASQYKKVPPRHKDDSLIPDARDIPHLLSNLNRKRAVSVGPQSQADAIEAMAYREKKRRDSLSKATSSRPSIIEEPPEESYFSESRTSAKAGGTRSRKRSTSLDQFRAQMGSMSSIPQIAVSSPLPEGDTTTVDQGQQDIMDEKLMFANLQKPRVRYDVEVITKLIVYAGIAWVSIEVNPVMFQKIGLAG